MISSLVWITIGVVVVVESAKLKFGSLYAPGTGFLPRLTGVVMVVLGLASLVQDWRQHAAAKRAPSPTPAQWAPVAKATGALVAYSLLLGPLGYAVATLLFMGFVFRFGARRNWLPSVIAAVLSAALSYVLFGLWLKVPLPPGLWRN